MKYNKDTQDYRVFCYENSFDPGDPESARAYYVTKSFDLTVLTEEEYNILKEEGGKGLEKEGKGDIAIMVMSVIVILLPLLYKMCGG